MLHRFELSTKSRTDFQDITRRVAEIVGSSGVQNGICHVFVPHTTAGIIINEHADPSVVQDIATQLEKMVPWRGEYQHREGNSPAHIKASLMGTSQTVVIDGGRMLLGTWQGIFFCEFDGPRNRQVIVNIVPGRD